MLPPLAVERPWVGAPAFSPEVNARLLVESFSKSVTAWERETAERRAALQSTALRYDRISQAALDGLARAIAHLESLAEGKAIDAARFRKKSTRAMKRYMREDPAKGAVAKIIAAGLGDVNDRVVRTLLSEALSMRAFRAELDPDARGGPTFDDPDELERFLLAEMA